MHLSRILNVTVLMVASVAAGATFEKVRVWTNKDKTYGAVATVRMAASPRAIRHAILHACDDPETRDSYIHCDVFLQEGPTTWTYVAIPLPVIRSRDYVLVRSITEDFSPEGNGVFRMEWRADNSRGPKPSDKHVRIDLLEGEWQIRQAASGTSIVEYRLRCEGGGWVPPWLVTMAAPSGLRNYLQTFEKVAKRIDREKSREELSREIGWEGIPVKPL